MLAVALSPAAHTPLLTLPLQGARALLHLCCACRVLLRPSVAVCNKSGLVLIQLARPDVALALRLASQLRQRPRHIVEGRSAAIRRDCSMLLRRVAAPLLVLVHNCTTSLLESLEADCSAAGSEKLSVAVQAMGLDAAPPCGVTTCGQK